MSSDPISTQRVGTAHRALWVLVTCTVAVGAFALAWSLRPGGDSGHDGSDGSPPGAEVCASLTAKLASADARVTELEGESMRCLKRLSRLDSCLTKQLECEKAVKEEAAKLAEAEIARAGAINEKNRATARVNESLSEANESNERISKLITENFGLKRRLDEQSSKARTDYDQLKKRFDKLCTECGEKCARSCSR